MYLAVVVLLMGVLPIASILIESSAFHGDAGLVLLIGKWFVFWTVGMRLLLAGVRQMANPALTADTIFGIKDKAAEVIVRELGFANFAIGVIGGLSLLNREWVVPTAIVGCLFYGLAGALHLRSGHRNTNENIAMISDLFIFVCWRFTSPRQSSSWLERASIRRTQYLSASPLGRVSKVACMRPDQ